MTIKYGIDLTVEGEPCEKWSNGKECRIECHAEITEAKSKMSAYLCKDHTLEFMDTEENVELLEWLIEE